MDYSYGIMTTKKQLGQFFTTNIKIILKNFDKYVKGKNITDCFCGNCDLLNWAKINGAKKIKGFDIDKKYVNNKTTFFNNSILNKKNYDFVLTNPPYLNKNKANNETKKTYEKEFKKFEDLYQISLNSILNSKEGILIVPLNFLSAENSKKIRNLFFEKFKIEELNIFTKQVFNDTTYNVISFYYKKNSGVGEMKIKTNFIFEEKTIEIKIYKKYDWGIGGEFLEKIKNMRNKLKIQRLTEKDIKKGKIEYEINLQDLERKKKISIDEGTFDKINKNYLILISIDTRREKLCLKTKKELKINCIVGKQTSRNIAHIIFNKEISKEKQEEIKQEFNNFLKEKRNIHGDLFLTNYRDNNRKRISFNFAYKLLNYIYFNKIQKEII